MKMRIQGSYEDLLEKARQARSMGQADLAVWLYSRIIERINMVLSGTETRDEQLLDYLITAADELHMVLDWMGDHTYAWAICQQVAELDPDEPEVWRRRAATERIYAGEIEEGLEELRQMAKEAPEDFWPQVELSARLLELGRLDEAESALDEASRRARNEEERGLAHWIRFRLLRERGEYLEAAQAWKEAREHDPYYRYTVESVYRMFITAGDYSNALAYLEQEENPLLKGYYHGLVSHRQGREARARRSWQRVAQESPHEYQVGREAWALAQIRLGNARTALNFLNDLTQQGYATDWVYAVAALAWAISDSLGGAQANLDLALRTHRQTFGPWARLPVDLWDEFDELVSNEDLKRELRKFFAVEGEPAPAGEAEAAEEPEASPDQTAEETAPSPDEEPEGPEPSSDEGDEAE
ncbi:MAG: hypothetical protein GXP39_09425 [Chloroflexi bacterium]|nr:hypothetical protein [Chloroflexota bacterium]